MGIKKIRSILLKKNKDHRTVSITVNRLNPITGLKLDPTILEYEISSPECFTSIIYTSGVRYLWPLPLRVIGGLEESLVVGTENQLSIFRDKCEKISMPILTYIKEDKFHETISELVSTVSTDITITRSLKIYKEFLGFVSKIHKNRKKEIHKSHI